MIIFCFSVVADRDRLNLRACRVRRCHSREGGNPENNEIVWMPAFAGMTEGRALSAVMIWSLEFRKDVT